MSVSLKRAISVAIFFCAVSLFVMPLAVAQQAAMKKSEVLARLKDAGRHKIEQGDIAAEIDDRGIDFELTDAVLSELKRAGAKSLVVDAMRSEEHTSELQS